MFTHVGSRDFFSFFPVTAVSVVPDGFSVIQKLLRCQYHFTAPYLLPFLPPLSASFSPRSVISLPASSYALINSLMKDATSKSKLLGFCLTLFAEMKTKGGNGPVVSLPLRLSTLFLPPHLRLSLTPNRRYYQLWLLQHPRFEWSQKNLTCPRWIEPPRCLNPNNQSAYHENSFKASVLRLLNSRAQQSEATGPHKECEWPIAVRLQSRLTLEGALKKKKNCCHSTGLEQMELTC